MIKNIFILVGSILLLFLVSYLATYGHEIKLIVGYFAFAIYTFYIIRSGGKENVLKKFLLIITPIILILSPLYFIDFENTKLSLPSSIALALGCFSGYLISKKNMRYVSVALTAAILFMFFKGHSMWIHKNVFGNFNSRIEKPLSEFTLNDVSGQTISNLQWSNKTVILNFWNIHCMPCIKEFPDFKNLIEKHSKDNRVFYGVNVPIMAADSKNKALDILNKYKGEFPNVFSEYLDKTISVFGINVYPTLLIIENNKIVLKGTIEDCEKYFASR